MKVTSCVLVVVLYLTTIIVCDPLLPYTDLFTKATGGYQCYRVPSLIITNNLTRDNININKPAQQQGGGVVLLAFAEGRSGVPNATTCEEDETCPTKSVLVRRSSDLGETWGSVQLVDIIECISTKECGYVNVVYDAIINKIFLFYCGSKGNFITTSEDQGATWSAPHLVDWPAPFVNAAPGHGIQIDKTLCSSNGMDACCPHGRLLVPFECRNNSQNYACIVYSDDHGVSWHYGGLAQRGSREHELVQIVPNSGKANCANIYSNARNYQKDTSPGKRLSAWSVDGGLSFSNFALGPLVEPVTTRWTGVVASTQRWTYKPEPAILFSHPNDPTVRANLSIHISLDETESWSTGKVLDPGPSAYSELVALSPDTAAVVYERGNNFAYDRITFVKFDRKWIMTK